MAVAIPLVKERPDLVVIAFAIVDDEDAEWVLDNRWHREPQGYAARYLDARRRLYLHREILGLEFGDGRLGDHINRNRLDNRRANLRILSRSESAQNVSGQSQARSRFRGVGWNSARGKWDAQAQFQGIRHFLGRFDSEEEAAAVVSAWRAEHMPFAVEGVAA